MRRKLGIAVIVLGLCFCVAVDRAVGAKIYGWGAAGGGRLDIPDVNDVIAISAGHRHSLAVRSDGTLLAWGSNTAGQCDVPEGTGFVDVAAGGTHSLALREDGTIAAFGSNAYGQCDVPDGNDYVAVAAGTLHSLALNEGGDIIGWGANESGQLNVPDGQVAGQGFKAISTAYNNNLALRGDGVILQWGGTTRGTPPVDQGFLAIAAGRNHSLAIAADGTLVGWGQNESGQASPPGGIYVAVAAGNKYSVALRSDGWLIAWGHNGYDLTYAPAGPNFLDISAGSLHALSLRAFEPMEVLSPNGGEKLGSGKTETIMWATDPATTAVDIYYSTNNGTTYSAVETDVDNTGMYDWTVPEVTADKCLIRIFDSKVPGYQDQSDKVFRIFECTVADLTGDCYVDFQDMAVLMADWGRCGDPNDPSCVPAAEDPNEAQ